MSHLLLRLYHLLFYHKLMLRGHVGVVSWSYPSWEEVHIWFHLHRWWLLLVKLLHQLGRYRIDSELLTSSQLWLLQRHGCLPLGLQHCLIHHELMYVLPFDSCSLYYLHGFFSIRSSKRSCHLHIV